MKRNRYHLKVGAAGGRSLQGPTDEKFDLEFHEYSTDGHWEHPDEGVSGADVVRLFLDYANDGTEWRESIEWKRMVVDTEDRRDQKASPEVYPSTWKEIAKESLKIFFKELGK